MLRWNEKGEIEVANDESFDNWIKGRQFKHHNQFNKNDEIVEKIVNLFKGNSSKQFIYNKLTYIYRRFFDNQTDFYSFLQTLTPII